MKSKKKVLELYGKDHYKKIGSFGGKIGSGKKTRDTILEKYGKYFYIELSKKASEARKLKKENKNDRDMATKI